MQGWHGPLARPAGLPARLSGAGRTVGNGLRMPKERLTRSVRRVAGRYGPVARATLVCNRSLKPDFRAPLPGLRPAKMTSSPWRPSVKLAGMLWKKNWELEAVLALLGGIFAAFLFGNLAAGLLRHAGVAGFQGEFSVGSVLLATLSFHGAALLLGAAFLKYYDISWREVFNLADWKRSGRLAVLVLLGVAPVVLGLKAVSEWGLEKLHWAVTEQAAVELIFGASAGVRLYLVVFTVILAPLAEEFVFRGLLFSVAMQLGWPKLGWVGVSVFFALMHTSAPIFLPLVVLAMALTWLYVKTESLLAPVLAHSLFNTANLVLLLTQVDHSTV